MLACAAALTVFLMQGRETPLAERYPAVANGNYRAEIMWSDMEQPIQAMVTDEEFQRILGSAQVKKQGKTAAAPDVEFFVRLQDDENQVTYSLEIGKDRSIFVSRLDDLDGSRTCWIDCGGDVFERLYACHVNNGGAALPAQARPY